MSREIKFRAWSKMANRYLKITGIQYDGDEIAGVFVVYGTIAGIPNTIFIESDDVVVLEQYTGLKDKNGKEIYEGDVLMTCVGRARVFYDDEYCVWKIFAKYGTTMPLVDKKSRRHLDYEVIGNIHKNPELLGGEK